MNSIEKRTIDRIEKLEKIIQEYEKLNDESNGGFEHRITALCDEIEILEELLEGTDTTVYWLECLEEDKKSLKVD